MNYYLTKRKKTKRSYWYAFFTDPNDSQKILFSVSVESLRRKLGLGMNTPITREREAYAIVERAITDGLIRKQSETTSFSDYVCKFWDFDTSEYITRRNQKVPNSIGKDYARTMKANFENHAMKHLPKKLEISQVTTLHIETVIDSLLDEGNLSNATIQKVVQSMSVPLKEARRKKLIPHNPMDGVEPLANTYKKRGIYTVEELLLIIEHLYKKGTVGVQEIKKVRGKNKTKVEKSFLVKTDLKPYLAVSLAAHTGMRMGEVRALCSEQIKLVNDEFGIIEVDRAYNSYAGDKSTKGKRVRQVPLSRKLCDELIHMAKQNPHKGSTRVFWSKENPDHPISSNHILLQFLKAVKAIGIEDEERTTRNLDFHSLRHTFNSNLRGRITEKTLRAIVGHESEAMSDRYTHEQIDELLAVGVTVESLFSTSRKGFENKQQ